MDELPTPITRSEKFLAKAAGADVTLPDPITREEVYLNAIANGGGGSGLPDYSAANDGDVLAISSGSPAWSAPSGGGGILFVEATEDYDTGAETLNKTWNEIHAAGFAIVEFDHMLCPTIRIKGNSRDGFTVVIAYVDELDGTITPYAFYNEDDPDGDLVYTPEEP